MWQAVLRLPDAEADFESLAPAERREGHELGAKAQDRLVRTLARLAEGMARDGADLVDTQGLPEGFSSRES